MTVNELIDALIKLRNVGVSNGAGERVIDGNSTVVLTNRQAPDDYWLVPLQVIDVDCFHPDGSWIVELSMNRDYNIQDSDRFFSWLDGEREDF